MEVDDHLFCPAPDGDIRALLDSRIARWIGHAGDRRVASRARAVMIIVTIHASDMRVEADLDVGLV